MTPDDVRHRVGGEPRRGAARSVVPAIFLLAGGADLLSGDFLVHGLVPFAVAGALLFDARREHVGGTRSPAELVGPPGGSTRRAPRLPSSPLMIAGVAYAIVVGRFARYSWPASLAVFAVAAVGIAVGWRHAPARPAAGRISRFGAVAWGAVFVSLALWELTALILQPSLTTDSYAHPTISVLMDSALASAVGRSLFLVLWLGVGSVLLER